MLVLRNSCTDMYLSLLQPSDCYRDLGCPGPAHLQQGWLGLGVGSALWLLRLSYRAAAPAPAPLPRLHKVERFARVESGSGELAAILLSARLQLAATTAEDARVKAAVATLIGDRRFD